MPLPVPAARLRPLALAAALAAEGAWATPAEEVDANEPAAMPTVVVKGEADSTDSYTTRRTASSARLDLSLRETPQSVSVVTRAQIEDFRLDSVNDMLATTTGVTVERVETDRTYYTARGFDIINFQYDGVGLPFVFGNVYGDLDTALYERVDIVRGANGLMSATGNPSATVNFIRKRPTANFQASASATFGSWDQHRVQGDISTALNEAGTLNGRVVAAYQKGDSYLDRFSNDRKVFYAVLEAKLARDTTLTGGFTSQDVKTRGGLWGALPLYYTDGSPTNFDDSTSTAADWARNKVGNKRSFIEFAHRFDNGWRAQATVSRATTESHGKLFYVYGTPDKATGLGLFAYPSRYDSDNRQTLLDASATGQFQLFGRTHDLSFGGSWSKSTLGDQSLYGRGIGDPLPSLATWNGAFPEPLFDAAFDGSYYEDKRKAAFVAARWDLADNTKLLTGLTAAKADSSGLSYGVSKFRSASKTTPYVGLVYDLNSHLSAYASYTGIFNPQSETDASGNTLAPIEGRTTELGLKGEWFDRKLNASAALFKTKQDNTAEQAGYVGVKAYYRGVNAESKGMELDLSGELARGLQATAGFTVMSVEGADGKAARTFIPRRLLRTSLTYQLPSLPQMKVGATANWQDHTWRDEADGVTIRQGSYALVGLMARYDIDRNFSVSANVNNVTDRKYLTSLYWSQSYYAAPRNASVTLSWKY
ncbi:TonB-dependent siderophore receptor [Pseudoduganella sp. UC29_106]|uniref:TonB-dependent siderophore receptor n=1 Tax=Pseudoduganella sp. UC29_106 TaxID=3374553 RepID=UPI0037581AB4